MEGQLGTCNEVDPPRGYALRGPLSFNLGLAFPRCPTDEPALASQRGADDPEDEDERSSESERGPGRALQDPRSDHQGDA